MKTHHCAVSTSNSTASAKQAEQNNETKTCCEKRHCHCETKIKESKERKKMSLKDLKSPSMEYALELGKQILKSPLTSPKVLSKHNDWSPIVFIHYKFNLHILSDWGLLNNISSMDLKEESNCVLLHLIPRKRYF